MVWYLAKRRGNFVLVTFTYGIFTRTVFVLFACSSEAV
jgi:hypothetical protein